MRGLCFKSGRTVAPGSRSISKFLSSIIEKARGGECSFQVFLQISDIFDPDRQANHRVGDTGALTPLRRQRCVRHDRRVLDQAFHSAQTFGEREKTAVLEKAARRAEISAQYRSNHSSESAHL